MTPPTSSDVDPPSYQESFEASNISQFYASPHFQSDSRPQASHLHSRLSNTRTNHIDSVITSSILPLIHHRVTTGLSRTAVALLPSPSIQTSPIPPNPDSKTNSLYTDDAIDFKSTTILGLVSHDSDEDLQQLPLTTPMDTTQFWSQDMVVDELRRTLGEKLANEGLGAFEAGKSTIAVDAVDEQVQEPKPTPAIKSRGFFSRKPSSSVAEARSSGDRRVVQQELVTGRAKDTIDVDVRLDEICLRTQSAFGLYETLTKPALIVRVQIQG